MATRKMPRPAGYHWDVKDHVRQPDGGPSCRWCKGPVQKPKRNWCGSEECLFEWGRRTTWDLTRREVYRRADGVCAICRFDLKTVDVQHSLTQLQLTAWAEGRTAEELAKHRPRVELDPSGNPYPRRHWLDRIDVGMGWKSANKVGGRDAWDVDHVTPVSEGGHWFEWENLRLLCAPCHKIVTALYAARRAAARREARRKLLESSR